VNDPDQMMKFSVQGDDGPTQDTWTGESLRIDEEQPAADRAVTFTSIGFIGAALRRSAWLWCAIAAFGVILGYGFFVKYPPAFQATTSVLLTNNPSEDPAAEVQTNVALAQSQAVAGQVVKQLGLHQSVSSFAGSYSVTTASDQVLIFTVGASSSDVAVAEASALVTDFLQFRASYVMNQEQLEVTTLHQQVSQAKQQVTSINQQISQLSSQPASPARQVKLASLQEQLTAATNALNQIQQNSVSTLAMARTTTDTMIKGSQILNVATPIPHSLKKGKAFYIGVTFIIGLVIGMIIVIVRALVSDRLRRRDDIAEMIGAPVKLSIGSLTRRRIGRRAGQQVLATRRLITYLNGVVANMHGAAPRSPRRLKGLAIVAVDNADTVAPAVVLLAASSVSQGKRVLVADLTDRAYAARRLRARAPGVHAVRANGADFTVVVPEREDIELIGPIPGFQREPEEVNPDLAAACASADFLITLATLDPASGADYLSTWATDAVAVVTAGQSSAVRIRAVGEMIRLAGVRLVSVVLIGADKHDESLGSVHADDDQSAPLLPL
jgi:capsular polysaccharide biosynthesis protein